jgi:hypothetical protein
MLWQVSEPFFQGMVQPVDLIERKILDGNRRMLGVESGAMVLHREVVVLSGQLTGMGREASCTLNALRVSLPGTIVSHFANCNIHHAPRDLPDGEYLMTFDGGMIVFQKHGGVWQALGN